MKVLNRITLFVFYYVKGENWKSERLAADSHQQVLLPVFLTLHLEKSMFANDQRLPK